MLRAARTALTTLFLLGAAGLVSARALAWGGGDAPDGTRFKVSPIGISHVLQPRQSVSPTRDCRWSPPSGDATLCLMAPGGASAYKILRTVPLFLDGSVVLCLIGAIFVFVRRRSLLMLRPAIVIGALLSALGAPALFAYSAPRALAALSGIAFGVGGTRGTLQIAIVAALLAGVAIALLLPRRGADRVTWWAGWAAVTMVALLPFVAFLMMFPPAGLAFALGGVSLGFGPAIGLRSQAVR